MTHYANYTAFDGDSIAPHLIQTDDFRTFRVRPLTGAAAANKGMTLFPRRIHNQLLGDVAVGPRKPQRDQLRGRAALEQPGRSAATQPPLGPDPDRHLRLTLETPHGWLVITHGVGPLRTYAIGALLLDLDDPTTVLAVLDEPLMTVAPDDRNGYVPNVVYSCGALLHDRTVLLPYGCSDATIRFAFIDLPGLLEGLDSARHHAPGRSSAAPRPPRVTP